ASVVDSAGLVRPQELLVQGVERLAAHDAAVVLEVLVDLKLPDDVAGFTPEIGVGVAGFLERERQLVMQVLQRALQRLDAVADFSLGKQRRIVISLLKTSVALQSVRLQVGLLVLLGELLPLQSGTRRSLLEHVRQLVCEQVPAGFASRSVVPRAKD